MTLFDRLADGALEDQPEVSRRGFLRKLGKAGVLLTGGLVALAVPATAMARNVACCTLAYDTDCPSNDVCRSCQSLWEWTCGPYGGAYWVCQECYTGTCSGCSKAFILRPGAPAQ
jgi:hypothetical protein